MNNTLYDSIVADAKQLDTATVLQACGVAVNRSHKCLCPFHADRTASMAVYSHNVHCFVCGAHFDNIDFIREYMSLTFKDALTWFDTEFGLGHSLNGNNKELERKRNVRQLENIRAEYERKSNENRYQQLMNEYTRLDKIRMSADPSSTEYANAVKSIPLVQYELDSLPDVR